MELRWSNFRFQSGLGSSTSCRNMKTHRISWEWIFIELNSNLCSLNFQFFVLGYCSMYLSASHKLPQESDFAFTLCFLKMVHRSAAEFDLPQGCTRKTQWYHYLSAWNSAWITEQQRLFVLWWLKCIQLINEDGPPEAQGGPPVCVRMVYLYTHRVSGERWKPVQGAPSCPVWHTSVTLHFCSFTLRISHFHAHMAGKQRSDVASAIYKMLFWVSLSLFSSLYRCDKLADVCNLPQNLHVPIGWTVKTCKKSDANILWKVY